jgi:uncharacterized metal-binding protein YceD (DUF177 family)
VTVPEFSRCFALNTIGTIQRDVSIAANADEQAALAARFNLIAINRLEAKATLISEGDAILCTGMLSADVVQECVATAVPIAASLKTDFVIRFVAHLGDGSNADEIEIDVDDCDTVEHDGQVIDLGESVAQTLLLALDPFPRDAKAEKTLKAAGVIGEDEVGNGAFAGLKGLLSKS